MTANEIITAVDQLKPNEYTTSQKLDWLTYLDMAMFEDIVLSHSNSVVVSETAPEDPADGTLWLDMTGAGLALKRYSETTETFVNVWPYNSTDAELMFDGTASELYRLYLITQIDFYNSEYTRYNNDSAMFNAAYSRFEAAYTRIVPAKKAVHYKYI